MKYFFALLIVFLSLVVANSIAPIGADRVLFAAWGAMLATGAIFAFSKGES